LDNSGRPDVYEMVVQGFQRPVVSAFYIFCMILLWWHLKHGVSSMFQTVGIKNKHYAEFIELGAQTAALLVFIGNCSIPAAILAGWIK
jgi:succinate dehydrogenase / fumarate reductase, cytochrome b subunit